MQQQRQILQQQRLAGHFCNVYYIINPETTIVIIPVRGKGELMKSSKLHNINMELESFEKLIQVMRDDSFINENVITMLKLDSYQRRIVLNNWLEQLRRKNASENLRKALSCLFDDIVAEKVLTVINRRLI